MKFDKYAKYGSYHWGWYDKKPRYTQHVDFVVKWIKEKNALDVGAGDGLITHKLGIRGVDNEPIAIKMAKKKGVEIEFGDVYALPYKDNEFDAVFMGDVLEHLEFPEKGLKEVRRILLKYLYVASPLPKRRIIEPYHYQEYTEKGLKILLENNGFLLEGEMVTMGHTIYGKFLKI